MASANHASKSTSTSTSTTHTPPLFGRGGYNGPNDADEDDDSRTPLLNLGRGGYNRGDDDEEEDGRGGYN